LINDFFSAVVVLRVYGLAPAIEFAAKKLSIVVSGVVLALSMKRFQN